MFDPHASYVEEILYIKTFCESSALQALLRCLDVLVRCEVVHDQRNLFSVKHTVKTGFFKFVNGYRCSDIITQHHIKICPDQLTRYHMIQSGMRRQDLLCHCHCHDLLPPVFLSILPCFRYSTK